MRNSFPTERLQRITRLASRTLDLPIAVVSLTTADGQEWTTYHGIAASEVERAPAFCTRARPSREVLVVEDAREEARFAASELVTGDRGVRFYAGAPLCVDDGATLGTLCVMDTEPRSFDHRDRGILRDLAATVVDEMALYRADMLRQHLFEGHPQPMFVYDVSTLRFLDVNAAAVDVYGYSRKHFLQMTIADIRREEDVPALQRSVDHAPDGREVNTGWRHRRIDGSLIDVEVTSYPIRFRERAARHVQIIDVTDREEAARALRRRDAMLRASGAAAERFLTHDVWDDAAADVLRHFGETVEVDRVYLAANGRDANGALCRDLLYEWTRPGVASSPPRRLSYDEAGLAAWVEPLRGQQMLYGPAAHVAGVDGVAEGDVTTRAAVPIFVRGTWWGFIGFDVCTEGRSWTEPELEALKMMASMLGAVIGRDEAERALRTSEQRYRTLIEQASDGILISREPHGYVEVNEQACTMTGYSREELLQMRPEDLITETDLREHPLDWRIYDSGRTQRHERRFRRKDGSVFPAEVNAKKIEGGLVQAILRDITERKRAEAALRESEESFRNLFDSTTDAIFILNEDGRFIDVNRGAIEMFGRPHAAFLGQTLEMLAAPGRNDADVLPRSMEAAFTGESQAFDWWGLHADGEVFPNGVVLTRGTYFGDKVLIATARDITERKQTEERLLRVRNAVDQSSDGIIILSPEGELLYENAAQVELVGYTGDEVQAAGGSDVVYQDPEVYRQVRRVMQEGGSWQGEATLEHRDGHELIVSMRADSIYDEHGELTAAVITHTDVTAAKEAQKALRESERRFRAIFEKGPLGMCLIDTDRRLVRVNEALCDTLGYAEAELIGRSVNDIAPSEAVDASQRRTDALFAGGTDSYQVEKPYLRQDGSPVWMRVTTAVLRDERGEARFGLGMFEDITERKAQQRQIIEAKHHAEEMNRLKSAFLANMSHEIRTPLTAITGFAEILGEEVSPENREFVDLISDSSKRLMDTLNSILDLAQLESESVQLHSESFDLVEMVEEQVGVYRLQAERQGIGMYVETPARAVPVEFDRSVMGRVLHNLVSNALKFTEEGSVTVGVEYEQNQVRLTVRDTGVGIDPSFMPYVFDEFKQESSGLTRKYDGTGLGLAITKRLVEIMGGQIAVESVRARGTTFTVTLPVEIDAAEEDEQVVGEGGRPRVLAVDDNDHTRRLLQRMIEANYAVDTVASGADALQSAARGRYDVVLMDVSLGGGISGEEVMTSLRERAEYVDVPIVAVTAHALPGDRERLLRAGFDGYVAKPFTRRQLLEALADGLQR